MKPGNTSTLMTALAVGLLCYASREARAQTWDVFNETYGSGAGEVSFNAGYTYKWSTTAPMETLTPGKATLSLDAGAASHYAMKDPTLPAYAGGGADVTLEWKIALHDGASANIYLGENESVGPSSWQHVLSFDRDFYIGYQANELEDYNSRNGASLAPPGFDSSVPHVYRLVRQGGVDSWYIDGQLLKQALQTGAGATSDGCRLQWGFCDNASSASSVDVYYFRAASGASLPPDTTPPTLLSASRGAGDPTQVAVTFSEAVQTTTATNLSNYSVNFGGPILAATRSGPSTVVLTLTSGLVGTVTNVLTINGVQDLASNSIAPNSQVTISVPASGWDVINENYGNGSGEVSFNASYSYAFNSTAPDETLSPGKATLDLHQGGAVRYPVKSLDQPAWTGGGADVTIEWKLAFHSGGSALIFLAENQSSGSSSWGHILSLDQDYVSGHQANEIEDYYTRDGTSLAPSGFDSSLPHVYRLVRQSGVNSWYLDGQLLKQPISGPGAASDSYRLEWGLYENANSPSSVDVYYLKAANVALVPGPTDTTAPTVVSAARGNIDYTKVTVVYSEPVQAGTAINPSHYSINHGGPVLAASEINSTTFILTLTSGLADTVVNTLTINGVKDLAGNSIAANTQVTVTYPPLWDVMNEKYGNGAGEVSFNASYSYSFGSTAPPETLSPGKATLSLDQNGAIKYPVKPANVPAWAGGGTDVTLEWKLAFLNGSGGHLWLSENQISGSSSWGHILSFNNDFNTGVYEANSLEDYYTRDGVSVAPPGFDGSLPHVYRIVRKTGTNSWYLDDQLLKQALVIGSGAVGDGALRLEWGFNPNADTPSSVDVYYFRAATGALVPGEATLNFVRNGNQLTFSWDAAGYALQENSVLTNSGAWTNTPGGNVSGVSVTMGAGKKYFRLKQQ